MAGSSTDEQSEDGELRQSPHVPNKLDDESDFSLSDVDDMDMLDIKPPQAHSMPRTRRVTSRSHRRHGDRSSKRDKHSRSKHEPRYHGYDAQQQGGQYYRDRKEPYYDSVAHQQGHHQYHGDMSKKAVMSSVVKDSTRAHQHRHRHHRREEKILQDLRQRLISKRDSNKYEGSHQAPDSDTYGSSSTNLVPDQTSQHRGELSHRKRKLSHEHEMRRDKLLETDREMARLKEQTKEYRIRRHLEKAAAKRRAHEEHEEAERKRIKQSENIVTVSDNSDDGDDVQEVKLPEFGAVNQTESESESDQINHKHHNRVANEDDNDGNAAESEEEDDDVHGDREDLDKEQDDEDDGNDDDEEDDDDDEANDSHSTYSEGGSTTSSSSRSSDEMRRSKKHIKSSSSIDISREHKKGDDMIASSSAEVNTDRTDQDGAADAAKDSAAADKKKEQISKVKKELENLPPYYPALYGCRSVEEFQCLNRIEEGTYGVVYRAKDKRTEDIVALKRLKMEKEKEGFPITSLREINTLLKGQHPNIVTVREIVVGSNMDKIFIVMDYVEHDLKSLMETMRHKKQNFMPAEIKCLLRQLLKAVAHLHDNWILHRDLKTSNLLLSHKGILKVGDFGLAREYGSPLKPYTPIVVTLWYRAPELLLGAKEYSTAIDVWSVGCIFAELLLMNAVFPGKSEVDQLNRIFKDLGTPNERIWPGFSKMPAIQKMKFVEYPVSNLRAKFQSLSELGLALLLKFLTFDPAQRITAEEAIDHAYFDEVPLPIEPDMFPTWPAKSELGHRRALAASPKPPSGGGEYKKLGRDADDDGYGFRIGMGLDTRRMGAGFSLKF